MSQKIFKKTADIDSELENAIKAVQPVPVNKAQCRICKDIIESKHRHDFVTCSGGHIFIDGGHDYQRCGTLKEGVTFEDIVWLSE
jgi:hypothetical protein